MEKIPCRNVVKLSFKDQVVTTDTDKGRGGTGALNNSMSLDSLGAISDNSSQTSVKVVEMHDGDDHEPSDAVVDGAKVSSPREKVKPPLSKQLTSIRLLVKQYNYMERSLNYLLLIESEWFNNWITLAKSNNVCEEITSINNYKIVKSDSMQDDYQNCPCYLKDNLKENNDFYLIPKEAWDALISWYGGGPAIPRYVFNTLRHKSTIKCHIEKLLFDDDVTSLSASSLPNTLEYADLYPKDPPCYKDISSNYMASLENKDENTTTTYLMSANHSRTNSINIETDNDIDNNSMSVDSITPSQSVMSIDNSNNNTITNHNSAISTTSNNSNNNNNNSNSNSAKVFSHVNCCYVCQSLSKFNCSKCGAINYCSKECQLLHWKSHKQLCNNIKSKVSELSKNDKIIASLPLHGRNGKVGLYNLGNSCYMNSSLQCLSYIKPLTLYFLSQKYKKDLNTTSKDGTKGALAEQYFKLLQDLWFESKGAISPQSFKSLLGRINPEYSGLSQQDAHEVIELLLDKLHEDLNKITKKPYTEKEDGDGTNDEKIAKDTWMKHRLRDDSIVTDTVGSLMRSQVTCPDCGKVSVSFEYHNTLQIAIPRSHVRKLKVIFVPEPILKNGDSNLDPSQLIHNLYETIPIVYDISMDRLQTVDQLKKHLAKQIPAMYLIRANHNIILLESTSNYHTLANSLNDYMQIGRIADNCVIYAYCPTPGSHSVVIMPRIIQPNLDAPKKKSNKDDDNNNNDDDNQEEESLPLKLLTIGCPLLINYDAEKWDMKRLRYHIWQLTRRFYKKNSKISIESLDAIKNNRIKDQLDLASKLSIRLITQEGENRQSRSGQAVYTPEQDREILKDIVQNASELQNNTNKRKDFVEIVGKYFDSFDYRGNSLSDEQLESLKYQMMLGAPLPNDKTTKLNIYAGTRGPVFLSVDFYGESLMQMDYYEVNAQIDKIMKENGRRQSFSSSGGNSGFTLQQCLKEHTKEETLEEGNEWYCSSCKEHKRAKKIVKFCPDYLPDVLILSLKRFEFRDVSQLVGQRANHREKIDTLIEFPIDGLDLSPYCQPLSNNNSGSSKSGSGGGTNSGDNSAATTTESTSSTLSKKEKRKVDKSDKNGKPPQVPTTNNNSNSDNNASTTITTAALASNCTYDLFAVCQHFGRMGFGHYTAVARDWNPDQSLVDRWIQFDDQNVSACSLDDVINSYAYILFYRKRKVANV